MSAYVVFLREKMKNNEEYYRYIQEAVPTLNKHHGEIISFNGETMAIEGPECDGGVILKFPNIEYAKNWYYSTEYSLIKNIRINATEGRAVIFEGNN